MYLRQAIVEAIVLNEECFRPYCLPDTVTEHAEKMKSNYVWGMQAEIFGFSVLVGKPITIKQGAILLGKACVLQSLVASSSPC